MDTVGVIELAVRQAALGAAGQSGFAQHLLVQEAVGGVGQAGLRGEGSGSAARGRGELQLLPLAAGVQRGVELQAEAAAVPVVRVHADHASAGGGGAAGEALQLGRHHLGSQLVRATEGPEEAGILLVGPGQGAVVEGREGAAARGAGLGFGGEAAGARVGAEPARGQHVLLARPHGRRVRQRRAAREQRAGVGQGSQRCRQHQRGGKHVRFYGENAAVQGLVFFFKSQMVKSKGKAARLYMYFHCLLASLLSRMEPRALGSSKRAAPPHPPMAHTEGDTHTEGDITHSFKFVQSEGSLSYRKKPSGD